MFQVTFFNPVIERGRRLQRQKKVFSKQHGMLQCSHTTFLYPRLDFKIFFPACCFSCFTFFLTSGSNVYVFCSAIYLWKKRLESTSEQKNEKRVCVKSPPLALSVCDCDLSFRHGPVLHDCSSRLHSDVLRTHWWKVHQVMHNARGQSFLNCSCFLELP